MYLQHDPRIEAEGLMYGWGHGPWLTTVWQARAPRREGGRDGESPAREDPPPPNTAERQGNIEHHQPARGRLQFRRRPDQPDEFVRPQDEQDRF